MFVASGGVALFDRYRLPYTVDPTISQNLFRIARSREAGPQLLALPATPETEAGPYFLDGVHLHLALADPWQLAARLEETGIVWKEETPILDDAGVKRASVYRAEDGSAFLPFDLDAPFEALLQETYLPPGGASRLQVLARKSYYRLRPLIPRPVQLLLRRRFRRHQERAAFPAWPTETALHSLEAFVLGLVQEIAAEPIPWLSPWPAPYEWALVLTHDVERVAGYAHIRGLRAVEERHGLRSAWYLIPERDYRVDESTLEWLRESGCEICLHGLRHDGRDLWPNVFHERLPAMRAYADQWGARGFRAPATHRDRDLVQQLGVEHDSSWSDVARYEPQPGGSCSWLPFFIGEVVELPITLPMDHTLFEVLDEPAAERWLEKAAFLRSQGGLALMLTHPDYLLEPDRLSAYEQFIARQAADPTVWHALPHEVASWWRERAQTRLERTDGVWSPRGPAAGRVRLCLGPPAPPPRVS